MRNNYDYKSVYSIINKFNRDLNDTDVQERDLIDWIGEALSFLKVSQIQVQHIAFLEVKNYSADLPEGFQSVIQMAVDNEYVPEDPCKCICPKDIVEEIKEIKKDCVPVYDCRGNLVGEKEIDVYRPYFDLKYEYELWGTSKKYEERFVPIRLSNATLYGKSVCKPVSLPVNCCGTREYTILGDIDRKLFFNFEEGYVAMSYFKTAIDEETGYPLVPDDISFDTAITYYIKWKLSERYSWQGRRGFKGEADKAEQRWLKYCKQAKNNAKMPKSIDEYQNLLEQRFRMIPNTARYYGFFGHLGRRNNDEVYTNPDNRLRHART